MLRVYEHDLSICKKDVDLIRLVGGSVPVPVVIHAEPHGWEDIPPFVPSLSHISRTAIFTLAANCPRTGAN
jgi:hypothetical protein